MVALLLVGIGVVVFVLWVFVFRGGYADVGEVPDSVEHEHLRRVAEARVAELSRGALRLADEERRAPCGGGGAAREFWGRFAGVEALVEEDPASGLREIRALFVLLEGAMNEVGAVEGVARKEEGRWSAG